MESGEAHGFRERNRHLLLVFDKLSPSRRDRMDFFSPFEKALEGALRSLRERGYVLSFSPILRTREEFLRFSNLYLDFPDGSEIVLDTSGLARGLIDKVAAWIRDSGAYRVERGLKWYWVLKPDLKPGEEFEIGFKDPASDAE